MPTQLHDISIVSFRVKTFPSSQVVPGSGLPHPQLPGSIFRESFGHPSEQLSAPSPSVSNSSAGKMPSQLLSKPSQISKAPG